MMRAYTNITDQRGKNRTEKEQTDGRLTTAQPRSAEHRAVKTRYAQIECDVGLTPVAHGEIKLKSNTTADGRLFRFKRLSTVLFYFSFIMCER